MGKIKFSLTAGALIRRDILRGLERACFAHDLKLDVVENKGFLDSQYLITISGDVKTLELLKPALENWFERIENES